MPRKQVTLREVAERAGLSVSAASMALAGHDSIPQATRARVQTAARALDYTPNRSARALRAKRHDAIALVVTDDDTDGCPSFYGEALTAIADEALRHQSRLVLISGAGLRRPLDRVLLEAGVDGAIFLGRRVEVAALKSLDSQGFPFLFIGKRESSDVTLPYVATDYVGAARLGTEHLLSLGHRRVALAVSAAHRELPWVRDRLAGYYLALQERGLRPAPELILALSDAPMAEPEVPRSQRTGSIGHVEPIWRTGGTWRQVGSGWDAAAWRETGITAIFAVEYRTAARLLGYLQLCDIDVPDQIAVVGFDDGPGADLLMPPLTTLRQPLAALGCLAARTLLAWVQGAPREPQVAALPASLIVRESCGAHRPATAPLAAAGLGAATTTPVPASHQSTIGAGSLPAAAPDPVIEPVWDAPTPDLQA